jgi:ATP-binding cassette subfamily F protein 3
VAINIEPLLIPKPSRLDERWGLEQSSSGGRFKLSRDLVGHHISRRAEVVVDQGEPPVRIKIPEPPELKTKGDAVHFDDVSVGYSGASKPLLQGVSFTVEQGGRCSFIGAVSDDCPSA